jgi:hypothetical protein
MGKVGQLVQEAQEFAQDHYNMDREAFYKHASAYQWEYSIQLREAISHWEEIQTDIALFYDAFEQSVEDPESPLYADNDLSPEDYTFDLEEGRRGH